VTAYHPTRSTFYLRLPSSFSSLSLSLSVCLSSLAGNPTIPNRHHLLQMLTIGIDNLFSLRRQLLCFAVNLSTHCVLGFEDVGVQSGRVKNVAVDLVGFRGFSCSCRRYSAVCSITCSRCFTFRDCSSPRATLAYEFPESASAPTSSRISQHAQDAHCDPRKVIGCSTLIYSVI